MTLEDIKDKSSINLEFSGSKRGFDDSTIN